MSTDISGNYIGASSTLQPEQLYCLLSCAALLQPPPMNPKNEQYNALSKAGKSQKKGLDYENNYLCSYQPCNCLLARLLKFPSNQQFIQYVISLHVKQQTMKQMNLLSHPCKVRIQKNVILLVSHIWKDSIKL